MAAADAVKAVGEFLERIKVPAPIFFTWPAGTHTSRRQSATPPPNPPNVIGFILFQLETEAIDQPTKGTFRPGGMFQNSKEETEKRRI